MKSRLSPTASMISERAGVSKSTVSRALKGHPSIPKSTRDRILAIARELGYEPNAMARSLVTLRSGVIGYVIGEIENPFYQEHLERLTKLTAERDMQLMLFQVARDGDLADVVPSMVRYRLDGCIIIATVPTSREAIEACARYSMPVVLLNRVLRDGSASSVLCNSRAGAEEIAHFLVAGGHQRIAFLRGRPGSVVSEDRETGFREGLAAEGVPLFAEETGYFRFESAYQAAMTLLKRKVRPDAIFAASDLMAFGVLDAMRDLGLKAPEDLSVIGFDDIRAAVWPAYNLTTVAQPAQAMLERAVGLLAARAGGVEKPPESVFINGVLRIRRSARLPPEYDHKQESTLT